MFQLVEDEPPKRDKSVQAEVLRQMWPHYRDAVWGHETPVSSPGRYQPGVLLVALPGGRYNAEMGLVYLVLESRKMPQPAWEKMNSDEGARIDVRLAFIVPNGGLSTVALESWSLVPYVEEGT